MRIALGLEYDGAAHCGWQSQPNGGGVQDSLERALASVAAAPIRVHCAGRTDAGVHALGQVVHFDADSDRPLGAWTRGTNAHLPASVSVKWAVGVPESFHARFSAQERAYRYLLLNRPNRPGIFAAQLGWYHRPLDAERMSRAAIQLVGRHDFSAFRAALCQAKSPIRTLGRCEIQRHGDLIEFDFAADGFLHHMVRNLVGALIQVGNGNRDTEWLAELLGHRDRRLAAPTFAPNGLYFLGPRYDPSFRLPMTTTNANPLRALRAQLGADGTA